MLSLSLRRHMLLSARKTYSNVLVNRGGLSSLLLGQSTMTPLSSSVTAFNARSFSTKSAEMEGKLLEQRIDKLVRHSPNEAIKLIEQSWESGKLGLENHILQQYFKAVGKLNLFDSLDVQQLLTRMSERKFNGIPLTDAGATANGQSMNRPLYVSKVEPPNHFFRNLLTKAVGIFLLISFASLLLDDVKGGASGGISSRLGMNTNTIHVVEQTDKSFADVVGIDEAKSDLQEIVTYLKNPSQFTRLGGKLPKGVLLTGSPGTGKTLLARAIAGEAGVPFFYTSGSEFEEMFVGVGARRVRDLFKAANEKAPCIIFIDEIDAIGGIRQLKDQSAMKMTLNQLLVEMDGFQQNSGVIVIAATNFPDALDPALTRPGRLDKHVEVPMPDIGGRTAILNHYGAKVPLGSDVNMEQLARGTPGFSGAELFNVINQAALKASVDGKKSIDMAALEYAKDKIMMGAERKSAIISPETMRMTAFHEAGHALVALRTPASDPIHKATIMPRGRALGMVMQLPDGDQTSMSKKQMLARLDVAMGGRIAEELIYGEENVTSGAMSDIQQATKLAYNMVTKYGLSDKLGMLFIDKDAKHSGETQNHVDEEVKRLLNESYARAKAVLESNKKELSLIATALMEYESLSGHEVAEVAAGRSINQASRSQKPSRETQALPLPKQPVPKIGLRGPAARNKE